MPEQIVIVIGSTELKIIGFLLACLFGLFGWLLSRQVQRVDRIEADITSIKVDNAGYGEKLDKIDQKFESIRESIKESRTAILTELKLLIRATNAETKDELRRE